MFEETLNPQVRGSAGSLTSKFIQLATKADDELIRILTYANFRGADETYGEIFASILF